MTRPLRVVLYDETCTTHPLRRARLPLGLSHVWRAGGVLYRGLGRIDRVRATSSWRDGLRALLDLDAPLAEVQYWGHGKWGRALVRNDVLDERALARDHALHPLLVELCARFAGEGLFWFRTCETFGAEPGHAFARAFTSFMGTRTAGHTFIIGPWQSGLHSLHLDEKPTWPVAEGLAPGEDPRAPARALWSTRAMPNTISFLRGDIPAGY